MRDVRPVDTPRSHQNWLKLRERSKSGDNSLRRSVVANVADSRLAASTSSSVSHSRPACFGSRSSGVLVPWFHNPCRSGSPHGVWGTAYGSPEVGVWPAGFPPTRIVRTASASTALPAVETLTLARPFIPFIHCTGARRPQVPSAPHSTFRATYTALFERPRQLLQLGDLPT